MINYEILKIDAVLNYVQVSYSRDGYETYYVQRNLPEPFSEESIHAIAVKAVEEAQEYWDKRDASASVELTETTGQIKPVVRTEQPEFNPIYERCTFDWDESGDERVKVWTIVSHAIDKTALNIRLKRDVLLGETDVEGLTDRSMTDETKAYRQALRDITNQETFPDSVIWPIKPIG
jgi:hypothetical protein